jgi:hypothetical protein
MILLEICKKKVYLTANMNSTRVVQDLRLSSAQLSSAHNLLSLNNKNQILKSYFQSITKNLLFVMLAMSVFTVGCDNKTKGGYSAPSTEDLSACTNNAVSTKACKVEAAGVAVSDDIANIIAANIVNGISIFGVTGTYIGTFGLNTASNEHRDKTQTQETLHTEVVTNAGIAYTNSASGYRAVPNVAKDDDGYTGGNVTYVSRTGWAANTCGTSQATVAARIADCAVHGTIGSNATWDGLTKGNAGQSVWKLVTRTGNASGGKGREVWRDEKTGLLWSSAVSTALNWCKASGANNVPWNPAAANDTGGAYCNPGGGYQNPTNPVVSACFEDDGTYFTTTDGGGGIDNAGKAGLNRSSTPAVAWRLPTKYDFQQADNDGIRFVMPDMGTSSNGVEWSASVYSDGRGNAWGFYSGDGDIYYDNRDIDYVVRCVGRS